MIRERAPAKLNLYLHVGPTREDGLHGLASLFAFTRDGDVVEAAPARTLSLAIDGPFAAALNGFALEDNLVLRAAHALRDASGVADGAALRLEKNLPVAAGIGGGSADAAAALRALVRLWSVDISEDALSALAFSLGADIPACLGAHPVLVDGAGEILRPAPALPALWVLLANPGVETPTGPIFQRFDRLTPNPPTPRHPARAAATIDAVRAMLSASRNDLEAPARALTPAIGRLVDALAGAPGALGARMSGSGATCFALFETQSAAQRASDDLREIAPWRLVSPLASG